MKINNKQSGEVSFFVLIFATLLFTVVTISFVRIMIQNQQQSSAVDLSQSAYDSAQAGVEDAKRSLIQWKTACNAGEIECNELGTIFTNDLQPCNAAVSKLSDVYDILSTTVGKEVTVKTGTDNKLNQAYTCVTIKTLTPAYLGELKPDTSILIPLLGTSDFDTVRIEWFNSKDYICAIPGCTPGSIELPVSTDSPLLSNSSWASVPGLNIPAIMRAQLIQFNTAGYYLTDFDGSASGNGTNNTHFLYPSNVVSTGSFATDGRLTIKNEPTKVECKSLTTLTQPYSCSATLTLPKPSTGSPPNHAQYLNLTSLYKQSNFKVTLLNVSTVVKFNGVQPVIDSTGRANELFKRIETRVVFINDSFPFPQGAIDLNGNFCKEFSVTDDPGDYEPGTCDPNL